MNKIQIIAKNTTFLLIASLISYIIGFFILIYTARYLGAEGYGILSLALAFTGLFGVFINFGLNTLTVREVSREKSFSNKFLSNTAFIKLIFSILTFVLIAMIINLIGYPQKVDYVIYLITISLIISSFSGIFNSIFQAHEKMEYQSISTILTSILMLSGVLIIIYYKLDIIFFASLYIITNIAILLYSFIIYSWKFSLPKIEVDVSFLKQTLKEAWPFAITGIFVTIYYYIDSVLLSIMVGNEVVGWYTAAYSLIMVLLIIPTTLNTVIFPVMSHFFVTSKSSLRLAQEKYFKYMTIIGIPIGVGTTLLANKIILLIFGTQYTNSIIALQILVWSSVIIFISGSYARLLEASNKQLVLTKITAICAIGNVILNILLIPKFSYIGASIVTVFTEFAAFILGLKVVANMGYGPSKKEFSYIIKSGFASLIMSIPLLYMRYLNLFLLILLAAIIYFIVIYIIKVFDKDDIKIFKIIINRYKIKYLFKIHQKF